MTYLCILTLSSVNTRGILCLRHDLEVSYSSVNIVFMLQLRSSGVIHALSALGIS